MVSHGYILDEAYIPRSQQRLKRDYDQNKAAFFHKLCS